MSLDKLRNGINLRAYAQKDPLIEYKKEAFEIFEEMMLRMEEQIVSRLSHVQLNMEEGADKSINLIARAPKQKMFETRNDPSLGKSEADITKSITSASPIRTNIDPQNRDANNPETWGDVGRNEVCPCGSGKKFKHCHGL